MNRETELDRAIRDHFAGETTPPQVHRAILSACQALPERNAAWNRERFSLPRKAVFPRENLTAPAAAEPPGRSAWAKRVCTALLCAAVLIVFSGALLFNASLPEQSGLGSSSQPPVSSFGQVLPSASPIPSPSPSPAPSGNDKLLQDLEAALDFQQKTDYYSILSAPELLAQIKDPEAADWDDMWDWPAIWLNAWKNPPDFSAYLASRKCKSSLFSYRDTLECNLNNFALENPEGFVTNLTVSAGVTDVRLLAVEDVSATEKNATHCRTAWDVTMVKEDGGCRISSHYFQYTSIHQMILEDGVWKLGDLLAGTYYNDQTDNTSFSSPVDALRFAAQLDMEAENPFRNEPDPTNLPQGITLDAGWEQNGITLRSVSCYQDRFRVLVELGGKYAGKSADDFTKFEKLPTLKLYYGGSAAFLNIGNRLSDGKLEYHFSVSDPALETELPTQDAVLRVMLKPDDESEPGEVLAEFTIDLQNAVCFPSETWRTDPRE